MKQVFLIVLAICFLVSCDPIDPKAKYEYESIPVYTWGYAEYYGAFYADYKNYNSNFAISLFSDSLQVTSAGSLAGIGQYLYIEDVFAPAGSAFLPAGTYKADSTGLPFTFYPGENFPVDNYEINVGTFIYYIEKKKAFTAMKHISSGYFTVQIADSKHIIQCKFTLSDSTKIEGTYADTLAHYDYSKPEFEEVPRKKNPILFR
jgi:hypothetical protein